MNGTTSVIRAVKVNTPGPDTFPRWVASPATALTNDQRRPFKSVNCASKTGPTAASPSPTPAPGSS
jgi:hypothetical protein